MAKVKTSTKKNASPSIENPSTIKSRRRNLIVNAVAKRITGDPAANWSRVGTAFSRTLMPAFADSLNWTETGVRKQIKHILQGFIDNLDKLPSPPSADHPAKDMQRILVDIPRKKRGKEIKNTSTNNC